MVGADYVQGLRQSRETSSPFRKEGREDRDQSVTLKWAGDRDHLVFPSLTIERTQIQYHPKNSKKLFFLKDSSNKMQTLGAQKLAIGQQMNGQTKCGVCIQWNLIQP